MIDNMSTANKEGAFRMKKVISAVVMTASMAFSTMGFAEDKKESGLCASKINLKLIETEEPSSDLSGDDVKKVIGEYSISLMNNGRPVSIKHIDDSESKINIAVAVNKDFAQVEFSTSFLDRGHDVEGVNSVLTRGASLRFHVTKGGEFIEISSFNYKSHKKMNLFYSVPEGSCFINPEQQKN